MAQRVADAGQCREYLGQVGLGLRALAEIAGDGLREAAAVLDQHPLQRAQACGAFPGRQVMQNRPLLGAKFLVRQYVPDAGGHWSIDRLGPGAGRGLLRG